MKKPFEVRLGVCTVWIFDRHCVATTFPEEMGTPPVQRYVVPPEDAESVERAYELGYGGDVWVMTLDHELALTWLAQQSGQPYSHSLHRQAGLEELNEADEALEQGRAWAYQRTLDKHEIRPWFRRALQAAGS